MVFRHVMSKFKIFACSNVEIESIPKPKAAYQSVSKNDQLWKTPSSAVPPHIHLKEPKNTFFSFTKHNIWPVITLNFSNYKKCTFSSLN